MIPRIFIVALLFCTIAAMAQEQPRPPIEKKAPASTAKKDTVAAKVDTLVSRTGLLAFLNARRDELTRQAEAQLMQLQGLIAGYQFITSDSIRVNKSLLR